MKASTAVTLALASSMTIFGLHSCTGNRSYASVEPVYKNGVMGVYYPGTDIFVPHTSPDFDAACNLIQQNRDQQYGLGASNYWVNGYHHHWFYYPGSNVFAYSQGGASSARAYSSSSSAGSSFFGGSGSHFGSARGGIGGFGASHGGGHGGGE